MFLTCTLFYKDYLHKQPIISFLQNRYSEKFRKIHWKTPAVVSSLLKRTSLRVIFSEFCEVLWNTFFIEHLRGTTFVNGLNDWWILKSITKISEKPISAESVFIGIRMAVDLRSLQQQLIKGITESSHRRCFVKNGVLKNFANFAGKHLRWSLFLIKLQALRPQLY